MKHLGPLLLAASALAAETPAAKATAPSAAKPEIEVRGHVGIEGQAFWREATDTRQAEAVFSTLVQPEVDPSLVVRDSTAAPGDRKPRP
jgi:hypothetical protein